VRVVHYGISIPDDYKPEQSRPLVLALHPGGERPPNYGTMYLTSFFLPALKGLDAIVVAPDCPTRAWSDEDADEAVMALLESVLHEYTIDRRRVLVVGYSLGGRGTWFMEAEHPDFFTAAIAVAGSPEGLPLDRLGKIPIYAIHSRSDEVVPVGPDQRMIAALTKAGRPAEIDLVDGGGHFDTRSYMPALARALKWVQERWRE
jgi:predicted peptidase